MGADPFRRTLIVERWPPILVGEDAITNAIGYRGRPDPSGVIVERPFCCFLTHFLDLGGSLNYEVEGRSTITSGRVLASWCVGLGAAGRLFNINTTFLTHSYTY